MTERRSRWNKKRISRPDKLLSNDIAKSGSCDFINNIDLRARIHTNTMTHIVDVGDGLWL